MKYIALFIIIFLACACESVIEPDLRGIDPQLVIEGEITNDAPPYTVRISQTTGFNEPSNFVGIAGATVVITDNDGMPDTLAMTEVGVYQTRNITGTPGHCYRLRVAMDGREYAAESTMPAAVPMDSLKQENFAMLERSFIALKAYYTDPAGVENFYRFRLTINGERRRGINLARDVYNDGMPTDVTFTNLELFAVGDSVQLQFMSIDRAVYTYFSTLQNTLSAQSAAPANPKSNIEGGCLGYFSANTVETRKIVIE